MRGAWPEMSSSTAHPGQGATVVSLEGVSKRFGAVQALSDITFDVRAGTWWPSSATTEPASPP